MNTRWKFTVAAGLLGIICFLAWAAFSAATRTVAIQFCGYRTNCFDAASDGSSKGSYVSAIFCLTNGSARAVSCGRGSFMPPLRLKLKTADGWVDQIKYPCSIDGKSPLLKPCQTAHFSVFMHDFDKPLRASIEYTYPPNRNKLADAFFRWMRWNQGTNSASIVIQDS
jgi:hypothetical protein